MSPLQIKSTLNAGVNRRLRIPGPLLLRILLAKTVWNSKVRSGTHELRESHRPSEKGGRGSLGEAGGAQRQAAPLPVKVETLHPQGPLADVPGKQVSCSNAAPRLFVSLGEVERTLSGAGAPGPNYVHSSPGLITPQPQFAHL